MIKKIIIILFLLANIIYSGCLNDSNQNYDNKIKNEVIIGINQNIFGFNPWIESFESTTISVNKNIFNTLVGVDEIYRIKSELAESWNNPNNLTWRFYLKENVKFHDGSFFNAYDVEYSINSIKLNKSSVFRELLTNIDEVKIIDNFTIDLITKKPSPILLNKLIDIMIISKEYHENNYSKTPVGTGPYKLMDYKQDDYIILERFDEYWGEKPEIDTVKFKIIENSIDRKNALINNSIDIAETIYPEYYNELSLIENINIKNVNTPVVYFLSFDVRKNSSNWNDGVNPFSFIKVRKAIYHAININEIIDEHLYGFGTPISQYVSTLIYGYNPNIERLPYELDLAKNLMIEAGFKSGFNVSLDCPDDNLMKNISLDISEQLKDINIIVNLNILSFEDWFNKIAEKNTIFYILGWIPSGTDGGEIYDYFLRTIDYENNIGTYNAGYYSNAEVDEIGEKISWTMDPNMRQKLIQQGFLISMDDVVGVPLFSIQWIYGISNKFIWNPRPDLNIRVEDIKINT